MAHPLDPITQRKLVLTKQLYQQGVLQSANQHSVVAKIMAVIGLDLAAETLLKAIVGAFEPSKSPAEGFQALLQQAESLLVKASLPALPDKVNILHVHSLRNDAQHKTKYPNPTDVSDCRTYARDFLEKTIRGVWGLSFDTISLIDMVQHPKVKKQLQQSDDAKQKKDYANAVQRAAAALELALGLAARPLIGYMPYATAVLTSDGFGSAKVDSGMFESLKRMRDAVLHLILGLNYADNIRLWQIAGEIIWQGGCDEPGWRPPEKDPLTEDDVEFVTSYCCNSILQIEQCVGDLEKPFGVDRIAW